MSEFQCHFEICKNNLINQEFLETATSGLNLTSSRISPICIQISGREHSALNLNTGWFPMDQESFMRVSDFIDGVRDNIKGRSAIKSFCSFHIVVDFNQLNLVSKINFLKLLWTFDLALRLCQPASRQGNLVGARYQALRSLGLSLPLALINNNIEFVKSELNNGVVYIDDNDNLVISYGAGTIRGNKVFYQLMTIFGLYKIATNNEKPFVIPRPEKLVLPQDLIRFFMENDTGVEWFEQRKEELINFINERSSSFGGVEHYLNPNRRNSEDTVNDFEEDSSPYHELYREEYDDDDDYMGDDDEF